jgi:hypothetical protein
LRLPQTASRWRKQRLADNDFFGLAHVWNDVFRRLNGTRADARERKGRAHQFHKRAASDGIEPRFGLARKFIAEILLELFRVGEFFKAAPVFFAAAVLQRAAKSLKVEMLIGLFSGSIWT